MKEPGETMKFAFYTLGCKVNQFETQAMERRVLALGHTLGAFDEACDCYIVNTCTVTAVSDKKCRAAIRRAKRRNPDAVLGVCGCYAQNNPDAVSSLGADVIVGTGDRMELIELLLKAAEDRKKRSIVTPAKERKRIERLPAGSMTSRTRAILKVEDGCDNYCTYCVIPFARGPVRSLPMEEAVQQAKSCVESGYRELVVTGIEISSWGKDLPGKPPLSALLASICEAAPELRIRLGSLEPRTVTEDFCKALSGYENLCPHFHLSLQSGSDSVLKRMHRKYDTARYLESVELLRRYFPGCAITTDVIVAFPGETEAEFSETLAFMKTCGFAACHIFPYSRRAGTIAAKLPDQHGNDVKQHRSEQAIALAETLERQYLDGLIGSEQTVLWEQEEDGFFAGHAPNYAKVYIAQGDLHNRLMRCEALERFRDGLLVREIS